jgi:hypothetical protein
MGLVIDKPNKLKLNKNWDCGRVNFPTMNLQRSYSNISQVAVDFWERQRKNQKFCIRLKIKLLGRKEV